MRPRVLAVRVPAHAILRVTAPAFTPKPEATVSRERLPAAAVRDGVPVLQPVSLLHRCQRARIDAAWSCPVPAVHPPIPVAAARSPLLTTVSGSHIPLPS
jgi:hypothetical protein